MWEGTRASGPSKLSLQATVEEINTRDMAGRLDGVHPVSIKTSHFATILLPAPIDF